ncbi:MAG: Holliday junction resolvase RuvX [Chloroflexi bacterium]|nr:Holliday junction resolvase RuvX [Chloroflexota bacterium]
MARVLGIDPGERRIGLALSDETGLLARPLQVLPRRSLQAAIAAIADLVQREGAEAVVVGLPVSLSGQLGPQAQRSLRFAEALRRQLAVPVHTWNEQYTTVEAQRRLREAGRRWKDRAQMVDAVAAAVLLQDYLDARR